MAGIYVKRIWEQKKIEVYSSALQKKKKRQ